MRPYRRAPGHFVVEWNRYCRKNLQPARNRVASGWFYRPGTPFAPDAATGINQGRCQVSRRTISCFSFCLIAGMAAVPAHAVVVGIDDFTVTRNGAIFFSDPFNDGLEPPSGPNGPATYNVQGTIPNTAEAGGLLQLDSANGDLAANADGAPRLSVRVRLLS